MLPQDFNRALVRDWIMHGDPGGDPALTYARPSWHGDCQALVWQLCRAFGQVPAEYAWAIHAYNAATIVSLDPSEARPGDIHYWRQPTPYGHVGIQLTDGVAMASGLLEEDVREGAGFVSSAAAYTARSGFTYLGFSHTDGAANSVALDDQEDLLMALSQYDQELTRNGVVDAVNRLDRLEKAVASLVDGSRPLAPGYPFPARDAVQSNLESQALALRGIAAGKVDAGELGKAIATAMLPAITDAVAKAGSGASAAQIADELAKRLAK